MDTVEQSHTDPSEVGQQIEELLAGLSGHPDSSVGEAAEELARLLMAMYSAGLERVVAVLGAGQGPGYRMLSELLDDELVASLLVLHDLHPEDTTARVTRALESVRPYLGSHAGGVELLGVDEEAAGAVVRLRLQGSCDGCPSSAVTVKMAIEKAIEEACPEVLRVDVEGMSEADAARSKPTRELPLMQIGMAPPAEAEPAAMPVSWVVLDPPQLRPGQCAEVDIGGFSVLLALPAGANTPEAGGLVAYRDKCPSCKGSLADAVLKGDELTCANCAVAFDVRLAGRALDGSSRHLDPLPLVQRAGGWRLAVPRAPVGVG
ncbi:MAG: NifU family protein [Pseudonocardiales bacterium]|nr:NifU family protein [Pseudonocardiales bacterium]